MDDYSSLATVLKALSVESRIHIVRLLKKRPMCVNALASRLGISQGAVSQHLRILRDLGLVTGEKSGFYVHYHLNRPVFLRWKEEIERLFDPEEG